MSSDLVILLWESTLGKKSKGKEKREFDKDVHGNAVCKTENLATIQMPNSSSKQTVVVLMCCGY